MRTHRSMDRLPISKTGFVLQRSLAIAYWHHSACVFEILVTALFKRNLMPVPYTVPADTSIWSGVSFLPWELWFHRFPPTDIKVAYIPQFISPLSLLRSFLLSLCLIASPMTTISYIAALYFGEIVLQKRSYFSSALLQLIYNVLLLAPRSAGFTGNSVCGSNLSSTNHDSRMISWKKRPKPSYDRTCLEFARAVRRKPNYPESKNGKPPG